MEPGRLRKLPRRLLSLAFSVRERARHLAGAAERARGVSEPLKPFSRLICYMTVGTVRFVRLVREEFGRAELDDLGFYLCEGCGYAHTKGSRCAELVSREYQEQQRRHREPEARAS